MNLIRSAVAIGLVVLISGCGVKGREDTESQILEEQPGFREVLDKKEAIHAQIADLHNELNGEKEKADARIKTIREALVRAEFESKNKKKELLARLDPEKENIRREISRVKEELKLQRDTLRSLNRMIKSTNSTISKSQKIGISQEEISRWQEQLDSLIQQAEPLKLEIDKYQTRFKILKLQLKALR